ncbi:MAG TPA: hypothetical protein PL105_01040, partial [Caldilineaceae bacterium]|nr:hypothetical protein [Caldilineaceae bacterium]
MRFMTTLALGFILIVLLIVCVNLDAVSFFFARLLEGTLAFFTLLAQIVLALGTALGIIEIYERWKEKKHKRLRQKDGSFALQSWALEGGGEVLYNPNNSVNAVTVFHPDRGVFELASSAPPEIQLEVRKAVERTHQIQAMSPGDDAIMSRFGSLWRGGGGVANAATGRLLAGNYDKPTPVARIAPAQTIQATDPAPPIARIDAAAALSRSTGAHWILGQADDGSTLAFEPARHFSLGIIGVTGTGKTASVGFAAALAALRAGWHVAVINPDGNRRPPDGGPGWYMLERHIELHDTDPMIFPSQVETVYNFFERRANLTNPRPVLVIFEEYGDINRHLRKRSKADADAVDVMLDTILTRGRKHSVHTAFIDQYPEHWSNAVMGGTKLKTVFQLGPGQGAKVEEYKAGQLPPMGRFLTRGVEYASFDSAAAVPQILRQLPAPDKPRRIINGTATPVRSDRSVER